LSTLTISHLFLSKPGLTIEPKEKGGEVTLQQNEKPCIRIRIPEGGTVTINNIRMLLKGPNKDEDITA